MFREPPPRSGSLFFRHHTSAPISAALQRSAPARGEADAQRRTFPPPRQVVAAVRNPVFRRPGCRRHAGTAKPAIYIATPEAVAGCQPPTQHTTPIRQAVPTDSVPLSALRSPPRCKAAQALPSGHTHLESPCRPSRRSKQAQFPSSNSRCTTGRSATPAPPPRRRRRPTADISATPAGEAAVRSPCRGALRRFCYRLSWWRRGCS